MKKFLIGATAGLALLIAGCGGGGGGGGTTNITLSGVVESITNNGAPNPVANVQSGGTSVNTTTNGDFSIVVPPGTNQITVLFNPPGGGTAVPFVFTFNPATADLDVGTLVVGPSKVSVTGRTLDSQSGSPVGNARVSLGGRSAQSASNGTFTIADVAFDPAVPNQFFTLPGIASASNYFNLIFGPSSGVSGGTANLGDLLLQPDGGISPPPGPFTITGTVGPANQGEGTTVELFSGTTLIRKMTTGSDRRFGFWVTPGVYTLKARKPSAGLTAADQSVTVADPPVTVVRDVTLN